MNHNRRPTSHAALGVAVTEWVATHRSIHQSLVLDRPTSVDQCRNLADQADEADLALEAALVTLGVVNPGEALMFDPGSFQGGVLVTSEEGLKLLVTPRGFVHIYSEA